MAQRTTPQNHAPHHALHIDRMAHTRSFVALALCAALLLQSAPCARCGDAKTQTPFSASPSRTCAPRCLTRRASGTAQHAGARACARAALRLARAAHALTDGCRLGRGAAASLTRRLRAPCTAARSRRCLLRLRAASARTRRPREALGRPSPEETCTQRPLRWTTRPSGTTPSGRVGFARRAWTGAL